MGRQKHMTIESEITERQLPKARYRLWYDSGETSAKRDAYPAIGEGSPSEEIERIWLIGWV